MYAEISNGPSHDFMAKTLIMNTDSHDLFDRAQRKERLNRSVISQKVPQLVLIMYFSTKGCVSGGVESICQATCPDDSLPWHTSNCNHSIKSLTSIYFLFLKLLVGFSDVEINQNSCIWCFYKSFFDFCSKKESEYHS